MENRKYMSEFMPNKLYKYYKVSTLNLNTIKRSEVYLSHPSAFNDPFDSIVNARANDEEILEDISKFLIDEDSDNQSYYDVASLRFQWGAWKEDDPRSGQ
jgi:hypothetical protein